MATKSPVFPMSESHHFSDYGFDPQIDYFQVLEEARRHKKEAPTRSIHTLHFNLRKPISDDDHRRRHRRLSNKKNSAAAVATKNRRWWRNTFAFFFFRSGWAHRSSKPANPASISGPIFVTESLIGSNAPFRATTRRPARNGELGIPCVGPTEINVDQPQRISAPSPMPIHLVT